MPAAQAGRGRSDMNVSLRDSVKGVGMAAWWAGLADQWSYAAERLAGEGSHAEMREPRATAARAAKRESEEWSKIEKSLNASTLADEHLRALCGLGR